MEDNKMGQLGFKIDTGELATSTIPEDFTAPEELYKKLITMIRKYHPSDDISMIEKAYQIASKAHEGQLRKSGEPYIIHPICVCLILAELELDKETIVAGNTSKQPKTIIKTTPPRQAEPRRLWADHTIRRFVSFLSSNERHNTDNLMTQIPILYSPRKT